MKFLQLFRNAQKVLKTLTEIQRAVLNFFDGKRIMIGRIAPRGVVSRVGGGSLGVAKGGSAKNTHGLFGIPCLFINSRDLTEDSYDTG